MNVAQLVNTAFKSLPAGLTAQCTFTRVIPGVYNAPLDTRSADTTISFVAQGVMDSVKRHGDAGMPPILQLQRMRELTVPAVQCTFPVQVNDSVVIGTDTWNVTDIWTTSPNGTDALYAMWIQR